MNRRDNVTKHHTGLKLSLEAIDAYANRGVAFGRMNLGLAYYVKWFKTAHDADCYKIPIGCETELMEDPETGADLGKAGAFSWHDQVPSELATSFDQAMKKGVYDEGNGGYCWWDSEERLFWSFDTRDAIERKVPKILHERALGGIFAWGIGEDAPRYEHFEAANKALGTLKTYPGNQREDRTEL